ncbi:hypothetical protein HJC23_010138 [Cyclotella cryptica]|uniref:Cyclin N-terminal domain-containing protein n=1 Tax=Cyclotella cryptica TaxID=29204 RepID=A0ABD3NHC8_9STRA|eukprot:CCRYP_020930-RA/>CCRYP_020930-RA protein AED:0.03 eAED:0.03 QI:400/1/1/1/1/1/2/651/199
MSTILATTITTLSRVMRPKTMPNSHYQQCQQKCNSACSVIRAMRHQETTSYKASHYLDWANVTQHDRKEMCQWGFSIVDACCLDHNLAVVAITYFDRFLSCRGVRVVEVCLASQREFQLAFITCLVISLKGREGMKISPDFVAETLCEQMYHPEEVIEMEIEVLRTLQWKLNGPTPQDFIQCFIELLSSSDDETARKFS